jgi:ribose-phosphate pyrophosphokinase
MSQAKAFYVEGPNISDELRQEFSARAANDGLVKIPSSIALFPGSEPFSELGFDLTTEEVAKLRSDMQGAKVAMLQSLSAPTSEHAMQAMFASRTLKRYGAGEVIGVHPFYAFARQEKNKEGHMESIGMDDFTHFLKCAEMDGIVTIEVHSKASEDILKNTFGHKNVSLLGMEGLIAPEIEKRFGNKNIAEGAPDGADKPDDAGQRRARLVHRLLHPEDTKKERHIFKAWKERTGIHQSKTHKFEGRVKGKDCQVIDDMADGGGTLLGISNLLKDSGAKSAHCWITHGILSGQALERLMSARRPDGSYVLDSLNVADTCPDVATKIDALAKQYHNVKERINIISTASMVYEETVQRLTGNFAKPRPYIRKP